MAVALLNNNCFSMYKMCIIYLVVLSSFPGATYFLVGIQYFSSNLYQEDNYVILTKLLVCTNSQCYRNCILLVTLKLYPFD